MKSQRLKMDNKNLALTLVEGEAIFCGCEDYTLNTSWGIKEKDLFLHLCAFNKHKQVKLNI